MAINYLYLFLFVFIIFESFLLIILKRKGESFDSKDYLYTSLVSFVVAWIPCIIFGIIAPDVTVIGDEKSHQNKDYFFIYIDSNKETHFLMPFQSYIDNNSNSNLEYYKVRYGKKDDSVFQDAIIKTHEFTTLKRKPDYYFIQPPKFVQSKSNGTDKYFIDYLQKK